VLGEKIFVVVNKMGAIVSEHMTLGAANMWLSGLINRDDYIIQTIEKEREAFNMFEQTVFVVINSMGAIVSEHMTMGAAKMWLRLVENPDDYMIQAIKK